MSADAGPSRQARLAETERAQTDASDPAASAWVSANAGAGKTHVLKRRVLRILLAGTAPDRILCLTYTKAAAAEMAARVFADLSKWATDSDAKLTERLHEVLARPPTAGEQTEARKLFARAIETPGGLKVQTIHAFCERLLQRFPLEAGVPPGFSILDDAEGARIRREATDAVLSLAAGDPECDLGRALLTMIAFAAGDTFDQVLAGALGRRKWLETTERLLLPDAEGTEAAARIYRRVLGVRETVDRAQIDDELAGLLTPAQIKRAAAALQDGTKTDAKMAEALAAAARLDAPAARIAALQSIFLTDKLEPRSDTRFIGKAVREAHPDVHVMLTRAKDRFADLVQERQGLVAAEASVALVTIASAVMQRYTSAKAERAALDFEDLVAHTANMLALSNAAEWVLYKLDGGLDHILVDEAQDTSPPQWRVIESLAQEFFAGAGATTNADAEADRVRTAFAVGDEKQSIYSFQGAEPRMFAEGGARFKARVEACGQPWRAVPLTLSFRTVTPVLDAVDGVFSDAARTPGPSGRDRAGAARGPGPGPWPGRGVRPEMPVETDAADAWLPYAEAPQTSTVVRLANRIADTIAGWLQRGERLASEGRSIRPGDVLILVRRRNPFAGPMVAALKARGIPVAGADRLTLTEQIAVKDLVALAQFLMLPDDDLSLATVLKSPLFDLDDDDLLRLAPARKGTLWHALIVAARAEARYVHVVETLKRWRASADQHPPFEFFAQVLDRDGGRRRLIERLGPEAIDPITEFIDLAIAFDESEPPSMTGFIDWLGSSNREVKRDMEHGRNEVRVLTVHGSKGLEAPIVFLPDTCAASAASRPGELVSLAGSGIVDGDRPGGEAEFFAWPVKGSSRLSAIRVGREHAATKDAEERNRLLYVAMTRARDRLYVCGYEGGNGRANGCWYDIIVEGLDKHLVAGTDDTGLTVRRLASSQEVDPEPPRSHADFALEPELPPEWARRPAPREPQLAVPLAPSKLAPYDVDESIDAAEDRPVYAGTTEAPPPRDAAAEPATPSPVRLAGDHRFLRGTLTHALLEHLPTLDPASWPRAARGFVDSRGAVLAERTRASIVTETLAVLADPRYAAVFGPGSRAEVPIVAEIPAPGGSGPPLRLNGQIDRLAVSADEVLIVDYKTNRPPPAEVGGVAAAYLFQLAAYVLALRLIYPSRAVRAAILWTDGPHLMEIPAGLIDEHAGRVWQLAS